MAAMIFDVTQYSALAGGRGLVLASDGGSPTSLPGLVLEWRDLHYSVPISGQGGGRPKSTKKILDGVRGRAVPGQVFAVMGPSGSGKTSLLNSLAGRTPILPRGASLLGEIGIGALGEALVPISSLDLPAMIAYVEQDDALFALSTVRETLAMIARLRLPDASDRDSRVEWTLAQLGLTPVADTVVGSDMPGQRGVSGGERKRVNIGCELLHQPRLIFVDEPTSGLDSFQAMSVMQTLKGLAKQGHTVVVSIHQPRSSIYQILDQVMLLSEGRVVYCGPTGPECDNFFASAGFAIPQDFNPADHFLDTISLDHRGDEELQRSRTRLDKLLSLRQEHAPSTVAFASIGAPLPCHLHSRVRPRMASPCVQFELLFRRAWREVMRDIVALAFKMVMQLFFSLIFGSVYFRMDMSQKSLQNRTGILFFVAMNQAFAGVIGTASVIPRQLKVVQRDRTAKLYGMLPFYLASMLTQLPLETLPGCIFGAIVYSITGLRPGLSHMLVYLTVVTIENMAGIGLGMVISASVSSVEMAPQVAPACVILFLMFSGFLLNEDSIPAVFTPLKEISFIRYSFQALSVNELKGNDGFSCKEKVFGRSCLQGDDWLKQLGFENVSVSRNIAIMAFEAIIFHLVAFLILSVKRPTFLRLQKPSKESV